jgi:hypothetical protein
VTYLPRTWFAIAALLSAANVALVWYAASQYEPWHAAFHAVATLGFGLWAQRLLSRIRQDAG